jgi:DNA-binding PadR family transcriptional regulator
MAKKHERTNDPTVLILTSLASGAKHGYGLLQDIEAFAGVRLGPGTLYGAISRMEDRGLIEAVGPAARRRPYRLSAAGAAALQDALAELRTIVDEGTARLASLPAPRVAAVGARREPVADERPAAPPNTRRRAGNGTETSSRR